MADRMITDRVRNVRQDDAVFLERHVGGYVSGTRHAICA